MILLIAFTLVVIVFSSALIWKSIKACRHRNAAGTGGQDERVTASSAEAAAPSAPLLTAGECVLMG